MLRQPGMHRRLLAVMALLVAGQLACARTYTPTPHAAPTPPPQVIVLPSPTPRPATLPATVEPTTTPGAAGSAAAALPAVLTPTPPTVQVAAGCPALPGRCELLGQTGGEVGAVATSGRYAYLGIGARLAVVDVASPAQPALVGETVPGTARIAAIAVGGRYACAADVAGGMAVVDVADPARPRTAGTFAAPSPVHDLALGDRFLYVASDAGVYVYDLADAMRPRQIAFYDTPGQAERLLVGGGLAFVSVGAHSGYPFRELRIVGISDPARPREMAIYGQQPGDGSWPVDAVGLQGRYAYVTAAGSELRVLDVANPAQPVQVGAYPTGGQAHPLACGNGRLTLAVEGGLLLFDVSDAAHPREVARPALPCPGTLLAVGGDLAYAAERVPAGYAVGDGRFASVLHLVNVTQGAQVGRYDAVSPLGWSLDAQATRLILAGSRLYISADKGGLRVLDVADTARPRLVGAAGIPGYFYDVAVTQPAAGGRTYALAADGSWATAEQPGLRIFDVTDPAQVAQVGFFDSPGNAMGVAAAGRYAYLADGQRGLRIVDLANPAHPVEIAALEQPGFAHRVAVAGRYVYVADDAAGLRVVDVSDPAHPRQVAVYEDGDHASGVVLAGGRAYVTTATGVIIMDLSDGARPVAIGRLPVAPPVELAVSGMVACAASGGVLRAYDVANAADPKELACLELNGEGSVQLAMEGAEVYLSTSLGGVWVLRLDRGQ